jgi:hypothetical protein
MKYFPTWPLTNKKGQHVGKIVFHESETLMMVKSVKASVHHLHKPSGWATDTEHLGELRRLAFESGTPDPFVRLDVKDSFEARTLYARLSQFDRFGRPMHRGHGHQTVLPDRYWQSDAPQAKML